MPKVVFMIIPNLGLGGAQRSFTNISNELTKEFTVVNVVFNLDVKPAYELNAELVSLDVKGGGNFFARAANFSRRIRRLRQLKRKYNAAIAISFLEGADYVNILSRRTEQIILSIRGSKIYDGNIRSVQGILRKKVLIPALYRRATLIIAVNKGICFELDTVFGLRGIRKEIIPNFYDHKLISRLSVEPIPAEWDQVLNEPHLVVSGRLAREKNILPIISMFAIVKRNGYNGRLILVGNGPEEDKIRTHCQLLGLIAGKPGSGDHLQASVVCVGADANPYRYLRRADCYIMASESEGFPNSLVEAMVLGIPVISSDCPWGPREIIAPGSDLNKCGRLIEAEQAEYGILMPMLDEALKNVHTWSKFLQQFLENAELRKDYGQRAKAGVMRYELQQAGHRWNSLISNL